MPDFIRMLFGSPTAEYQAQQLEASQDQDSNDDAASDSEGNREISSSNDNRRIPPLGSPPTTPGTIDNSQRVLNRVRSLPRLKTGVAPEPSSPDQANMAPMSSGANIPDPAAPETVRSAISAIPPSLPAHGGTFNERLPAVPDVLDGSVSWAYTSSI